MSQILPPNAESEQQPITLAKKIRGNHKIIIIIVVCIGAIGLWLFAILTRPEIKTSVDTLVITKIRFADRIPSGCTSSSPQCSIAEPGYRILIISMKPKSGNDIQALSNAIPRDVYVVTPDGSQWASFNMTATVSPPVIDLAFGIKDSERNFKLVWAGNPDIELNPLLYIIP